MFFTFFHLMPWPHLPADFDTNWDSASVTLPNRFFDPAIGADLYNEYLDQLEAAERFGFDAVALNEHHQSAYGLMPSPNIVAAALARRTERIKIAVLGNAIAVRDHPLRVAEELAMLDNITRGRIISGFVRAIGFEYYIQAVNPTHSRDRFLEAHDLIVKAWTTREPFEYYGDHYEFRYVNVWPRTVQDPHPPIWVPGSGSRETMQWVAERRYTFLSVYAPSKLVKVWFDTYRAAADNAGYEPAPEQIGLMLPVYVADTDEQAHAAARSHLEWLYQKALKVPRQLYFPPGYLSLGSLRGMLSAGAKQFAHLTYEDLIEGGYAVVGSADTVAERLAQLRDELGFGTLCAVLQIGDMGHAETLENVERFGTGVIPALR
jgi:alkanesulfonate monooxygenase SsuD/methylene tetrahydromethanopterin reductase-like flavin-dependent oxidoreductase (luciferase family)